MRDHLFSVEEIPLPGAIPTALNNRGEVVGNAEGHGAFYWRRGEPVIAFGTSVAALAINDSSLIVGECERRGTRRPFALMPHDNQLTGLPLLHGHTLGCAMDINNQGVIVGYSCQGHEQTSYSRSLGRSLGLRSPMFTVWHMRDRFRAEAVAPSGHGVGYGVSDDDVRVGVFNPHNSDPLETPPEVAEQLDSQWFFGTHSRAVGHRLFPYPKSRPVMKTCTAAISSSGLVVANHIFHTTAGPAQRAVCLEGDESWELALELKPGEHTQAGAINRLGTVVGCFGTKGRERAFIGDRTFAGELLPLVAGATGWEFREAKDVNDRGQIVGWGYHDGRLAGFLLDPS